MIFIVIGWYCVTMFLSASLDQSVRATVTKSLYLHQMEGKPSLTPVTLVPNTYFMLAPCVGTRISHQGYVKPCNVRLCIK